MHSHVIKVLARWVVTTFSWTVVKMQSCEVGIAQAEALSTLMRKMRSIVPRKTPVSRHVNNDSSST